MKNLFLFLFCFLCSLIIQAQTAYDSLYQRVENLHGQEKMDAYYEFTQKHLDNSNVKENFELLKRYRNDAKQENSIADESYALDANLTYLFMNQMFNEYLDLWQESMNFFLENNRMNNYYSHYMLRNEIYVMTGKYQTAIKTMKQFYDDNKSDGNNLGTASAAYSLGFTYTALHRYDKADYYYKEAISIFETISDEKLYDNLSNAYERYAEMLRLDGRFDEVIPICAKAKKSIIQYYNQINMPIDTSGFFVFCNMTNAYAYMGLNQYDKAYHYIELMQKGLDDNLYTIANYKTVLSFYYDNIGETSKALKLMAEVVHFQGDISDDNIVLYERKKDLAHMMYRNGRYKEAYEIYQEYNHVMDSVKTYEVRAQIEELSTLYELDKMKAAHERQRMQIFYLAMIVILLIMILLALSYFNRIMAKKNRVLYEQIQERVMNNEDVELMIPLSIQESTKKLVNEIDELVVNERLFKDINITRKFLSDKIKVDEIRISDALKDARGVSFSKYINDVRLNYACKMIISHPDLTLDYIAEDSGFNSRSNFFRLFTGTYGMSPGEFRKMRVARG